MPATEPTGDDAQTQLEAMQELRTTNTAGTGGSVPTKMSRVKKKPVCFIIQVLTLLRENQYTIEIREQLRSANHFSC